MSGYSNEEGDPQVVKPSSTPFRRRVPAPPHPQAREPDLYLHYPMDSANPNNSGIQVDGENVNSHGDGGRPFSPDLYDSYRASGGMPSAQEVSALPPPPQQQQQRDAYVAEASNDIPHPKTTAATTTAGHGNSNGAAPGCDLLGARAATTATDRESFYARILAEGPSIDEVAARATPAYVKSLMQTINRNEEDTARVLGRLDELRLAREKHYMEDTNTIRSQTAELQMLRQQMAQLTLQLQEERERSSRLLHENTVMYAQEAEQQERLAALVALAQSRGKALQQQQQRRQSGSGGGRPFTPSPRATPPLTNSLSLRAVTSGAVASAPTSSHKLPLQQQQQRPLRKEESIMKEESSHGDDEALRLPARAAVATTGTSEARGNSSSGWIASQGEGESADEDFELLAALCPSANATAAHIVALTEEVQALRQQLDEQRAMYERERGVRLQQERDQHREQLEAQDRQSATIVQLQELHECALKDLVVYRHRTDRELRDLRGQVDWLKQSLSEAIAVAESARRQHHVTATAMSLRAEDHYRPKMRSLMMELTNKRQTAQQDRKTFEQAVLERESTIADLTAQVKRERQLRKRAEERHKLEVQGVRSELDMMRQSLRQVEKKVFFARAREDAAVAEGKNIMDHYYGPA